MQSLWNDSEATQFEGPLGQRVYSSRLLGRDTTLVLHGGGNTSVKLRERNLVGDDEDILYVKGSGWDLATIQAGGFAPVRLAPMLRLAELENLSDPQMVNALQTQTTRAGAPAPSVETILHAVLPYRYVDHTHADAVVTITNTAEGESRIREIYGDRVVVIPYVMPGFDLAREVARRFPKESGPDTIGMVLLNHGIFSFGETARDSYERMIELVGMAEGYLAAQGARLPSPQPLSQGERGFSEGEGARGAIAQLRADISRAAGAPMILSVTGSDLGAAFDRRPDVADIARRGPATPDHVIRTKPLPMVGRDVAAFGEEYKAYFAEHEPKAKERKTMLDTAPRVVLDGALGLCCAGRSATDAGIVADIYEHTMECILRAERLGGWQALPMHHLFDMEYWDLEQAKLRKGGKSPMFQGEVALITGAASGIGRACAESFLQRGAAVIGLDLNPAVVNTLKHPAWLGIPCDVSDESALNEALEKGVRRFGGLDMLVLNAGLFPGGKPVSQLSGEEWRKVMAVNLDANLALLREAHPLLKLAPGKGRVVVIGSKNVPAPGPGAAAYSASKAALTQLMRVVALEWGSDGIRLNALHPNAVFDTGIWTEEVLQARAKHYGVTVEQYKTNNVLSVEVTSRDVAELAAEMCGPLFAKTTAAQVPVDGGNERVI